MATARRACACDLRADVGRLDAVACTCSRSRAASCASTRHCELPARRVGAARALRRRVPRRASTWPTCSPTAPPRRDAAAPTPACRGARRAARRRAPSARPIGSPARRRMPRARRAAAFVDFQNDVTAKDLALAAREGFRSIEHVKRYTTTGMATDQGKTSQHERARRSWPTRSASRCRRSGSRPSARPTRRSRFGALAGHRARRAVRSGPHARRCMTGPRRTGARVRGRRRCGSAPATSRAPARTCTRRWRASAAPCAPRVGIFDASTLGKIEVVGPGRGRVPEPHLRRTPGRSCAVGRCRYGLMLREDGFVMRRRRGRAASAPDRFHVTTTTGGAAARAGA